MLIPSIDLRAGHAVQLRGGRDLVLDAGDPWPWLRRFARVGEIAVVDLDAALGTGEHRELMQRLCAAAPCRIGGGIRDASTARAWLDAGASKVVLGTRAVPEVLRELPAERVVAALDAVHGEVVVDGWRTRTGRSVVERMRELRPLVGGFLVTCVEREGRLSGIDLGLAAELHAAADGARLTLAGGVATAQDVAALDALGVDAQVGMALYTNVFTEADVLAAQLRARAGDGPWATVVCDERGIALGLAWSDAESLAQALATGRGVYRSRRRGLWVKGATSGAVQDLLRVELDCDRDALRFVVRQHGDGFCHQATRTCWGAASGLEALQARLARAAASDDAASYTRRLLADPAWLRSKLCEEAGELADASADRAVAEAADLVYFASVALQRAGVAWSDVEAELDRRALRLTRRPGLAKPAVQP